MALINLGDDPWLFEFESCEKSHRDIMELLTLRQRQSRNTEKYSQLSATIRQRLKQYNSAVSQLNQNLNYPTSTITIAETERRTRQIETLHSKAIQMQKLFDEQVSNKMLEDRASLMQGAGSSVWGETPEVPKPNYSSYSVDQIRSEQKRMLGDQDKGLENLSQIISRQRNIAQTISDEVEYHNDILDDLGTHVERTDQRVRTETSHISVVDNKDKTCVYWVVIILLFFSIIAVALI